MVYPTVFEILMHRSIALEKHRTATATHSIPLLPLNTFPHHQQLKKKINPKQKKSNESLRKNQ